MSIVSDRRSGWFGLSASRYQNFPEQRLNNLFNSDFEGAPEWP